MDEWTAERYPGVTRADLERERRARPKLRKHPFTPTGRRTYGARICSCGSLENDSVHQVPEVTEEQREAEQRKVGERGSS